MTNVDDNVERDSGGDTAIDVDGDSDADRSVEPWPVVAGAVAQWAYVLALLLVEPLAETGVAGVILVAATGVVGGAVAGDLAGGSAPRCARHGLAAGVVGGATVAVVGGGLMAVPGAPQGAFEAVSRLVATHSPPGIGSDATPVASAVAAGLGVVVAGAAAAAGWRAPARPASPLGE